MKDIGHIPDTLIKVGHELMSEGKVLQVIVKNVKHRGAAEGAWLSVGKIEGKVLQVIVKIDVKHRGAAEGSWLSVGKIEIPCFCFLYVGKVHKSSV